MSTINVFPSFVLADKSARDQVLDWARSGDLGDAVVGYEPDNIRPQNTSDEAPDPPPALLTGANKVLVIVGANTASYRWIDSEIDTAAHQGIGLVVTRAPGTNGPIPTGAAGVAVTGFDPRLLKEALRR